MLSTHMSQIGKSHEGYGQTRWAERYIGRAAPRSVVNSNRPY